MGRAIETSTPTTRALCLSRPGHQGNVAASCARSRHHQGVRSHRIAAQGRLAALVCLRRQLRANGSRRVVCVLHARRGAGGPAGARPGGCRRRGLGAWKWNDLHDLEDCQNGLDGCSTARRTAASGRHGDPASVSGVTVLVCRQECVLACHSSMPIRHLLRQFEDRNPRPKVKSAT